MELKIDHVTKKFKDLKAVSDASVKFIPGLWGLLGPNGAGKTTLMRMMVGNVKASRGNIYLDERSISQLGSDYLDKLGYLPQHFGYDKNQSVNDFLQYIATLKGIDKATMNKRIRKLLEQFNLKDVKNKKVDKLSGGMKRRVGICQAMLNDPDILIIDEPTAGLDIEERRKFRKYLTQISKEKIVIISTHIVSDVEFIANYLVIMEKGKIIEVGKSNELIHSIDGTVFETIVKEEDMNTLEEKYNIINFRNEEEGLVKIRYIAEKPLEKSERVKPDLNDYYLSKVKVVK